MKVMQFKFENKNIGSYNEETKEFHKYVQPDKHYMKKYQGYGIDYTIVDSLPVETKVFIHTPEKTLETTIEKYQKQGLVDDFGFGKQVFLATDNF